MHDKITEPVLTDYDITINSIHQENMFKGTIAVCIVYAIFAFALIIAAYFFDNIRDLLFDRFLPFTLIYIIGTIIIILIFIYYIVSFVPKKIDKNKIDDSISCPDYWNLEILDDNAIIGSFDTDTYNKKLFKYRCVMDDNVFNKGAIYKQNKGTKADLQYRLGNKPAFIGNKNGTGIGNEVSTNYNDIYNNANTNTSFITNNKDDKYLNLYKNVNSYESSNLNYTNNANMSKNIRSDLKEAALIMNNYKKGIESKTTVYTDITNVGGDNLYSAAGTKDLDVRFTINYYNSPSILTWATSNAHDSLFYKTSYRNSALVIGTDDKNYTSTVYDWSTMNSSADGKVYAFDFGAAVSSANFVELGEIKKDANDKIYFKGLTSINIPINCFTTKITNNMYYFNDTYVSTTIPTGKVSEATVTSSASTYKKGPKVRLFHKTERQPKIIENDNMLNENIPLSCSAVYPSLLASKEDKYSENNTLRCAYSKICDIPWSDLHCNEISLS